MVTGSSLGKGYREHADIATLAFHACESLARRHLWNLFRSMRGSASMHGLHESKHRTTIVLARKEPATLQSPS